MAILQGDDWRVVSQLKQNAMLGLATDLNRASRATDFNDILHCGAEGSWVLRDVVAEVKH